MDMNASSGIENATDFPEMPSYADGRGVRSGVDLRVLRYFLAVADEGNITWAAELLQISQPTLSRQLKGLEDALGVTLFHRGPHQISLTPEGRLLRERAQELVQLAGKMEREVRELHGSLSGTIAISRGPHQISLTPEGRLLRERAQELVQLAGKMEREVRELHGSLSGTIAISCAETHSMDWLARCIAAFRQRYPEVEFEMRTCTADVTGDRLEQGLADLGLVTEPLDVSRYDYLRTHIDDRWGILMRSDDPLSTLNEIRPEDLAGRALVLPFRDEVRGELVSWMGGSLRAVSTAGLCDLSINVMAMVRGGVGLAMSFGLGVPDEACQLDGWIATCGVNRRPVRFEHQRDGDGARRGRAGHVVRTGGP